MATLSSPPESHAVAQLESGIRLANSGDEWLELASYAEDQLLNYPANTSVARLVATVFDHHPYRQLLPREYYARGFHWMFIFVLSLVSIGILSNSFQSTRSDMYTVLAGILVGIIGWLILVGLFNQAVSRAFKLWNRDFLYSEILVTQAENVSNRLAERIEYLDLDDDSSNKRWISGPWGAVNLRHDGWERDRSFALGSLALDPENETARGILYVLGMPDGQEFSPVAASRLTPARIRFWSKYGEEWIVTLATVAMVAGIGVWLGVGGLDRTLEDYCVRFIPGCAL